MFESLFNLFGYGSSSKSDHNICGNAKMFLSKTKDPEVYVSERRNPMFLHPQGYKIDDTHLWLPIKLGGKRSFRMNDSNDKTVELTESAIGYTFVISDDPCPSDDMNTVVEKVHRRFRQQTWNYNPFPDISGTVIQKVYLSALQDFGGTARYAYVYANVYASNPSLLPKLMCARSELITSENVYASNSSLLPQLMCTRSELIFSYSDTADTVCPCCQKRINSQLDCFFTKRGVCFDCV